MLNNDQKKAIKKLEKALNNVGKLGLSGGVYDGVFVVFDSKVDREEAVELLMTSDTDCSDFAVDLHTPKINLDGNNDL